MILSRNTYCNKCTNLEYVCKSNHSAKIQQAKKIKIALRENLSCRMSTEKAEKVNIENRMWGKSINFVVDL